MKITFLTEMNWAGKVPINHPNMRTEFAWMHALNATHENIHNFLNINDNDVVFLIFPKATTKLNLVGSELLSSSPDKDISIYSKPIIETLRKNNNKKICIIQEGPVWFFNDYELDVQFHFYNILSDDDIIFAHNTYDCNFYSGLVPHVQVEVIPSLMIINETLKEITWKPENKVIIGGNFARWYGGFQSYIVASELDCPIFVPESHCKRNGENLIPNLTHLPWVLWDEWIKQLSNFKYAIHLMPTVAAGTFSMNCGYFGIPCVGNKKIDTQKTLFPDLSVDVDNLFEARKLSIKLHTDKEFYNHCSNYAKKQLDNSFYFNKDKWTTYILSKFK